MQEVKQISSKIHDWTLVQFPLAREREIAISDPLLDSGIVDSLGTLDIVMYLENEFGIVMDEEDMIPEHFESVEAIASFVCRKNGSHS